MPSHHTATVPDRREGTRDALQELHDAIDEVSSEHPALKSFCAQARATVDESIRERSSYRQLNRRLSEVSANSAELFAELEENNRALDRVNGELSMANVHAAEMMAEIELQSERIKKLNRALAEANSASSEMVVQLQLEQRESARLNRELSRTSEEKSHLLGVVAHDLRAGIGGMAGIAELLVQEIPTTRGETYEYAALIHRETGRLLHLLGGLLTVSQVEQGRLELKSKPATLGEIVRQSCQLQTKHAQNKQQVISTAVPDQECSSDCDPTRIRQVVDNLISNAIKYSPLGSSITVSVWSTAEEVGVWVRDEGGGLTDADLGRVFKSFQRLSATPTAGEDSHGLGLAISHKIIELHGGWIRAKNRSSGPGARFGFGLPRCRPAKNTGPATVKQRSALRILVAEDTAVNQHLIKVIIRRSGHEVEVVADGAEAVAACQREEFDLVLLDLEMPRMNGYEAARTIRQMESASARVPMIALTGHDEADIKKSVTAAGMDDVATKPLSKMSLANIIDQWIP